MSAVSALIRSFEAVPLPDPLARAAIAALVRARRRRLAATGIPDAAFARAMAGLPIVRSDEIARTRHGELPSRFHELLLGPRRRCSCCRYSTGTETLAEAELSALQETLAHARLVNGQRILELGCGWGSLSLFMATRLPSSSILAVCDSANQRIAIEATARRLGLENLEVVTADLNAFSTRQRFDRVVSVETFERVANWGAMLERINHWLEAEGRLFLHVFSHARHPYRLDRSDWVARNFLAGRIMPSHGLIRQFGGLFTVEDEWRWSGMDYAHTARHWLQRFDDNRDEIDAILRVAYGAQAPLWRRRWRLFLLAISEQFGCDGGRQWGVSQFRLAPIP